MAFLEVEYVSKYFSEANGQELCVQGCATAHSEERVRHHGRSPGCGKARC
jgi:hypothetical protein